VNLAEKQQQMIENYGMIDDPLERLSAVVDRARTLAPLPETERIEANRITGCISRAWLVGEIEEGRCKFRADADSPLAAGKSDMGWSGERGGAN